MTEQENKSLEEKETKNKFWKGVLVGALVMAFCGLIVVGMAAGIWIVGRKNSIKENTQVQAAASENSEESDELDMDQIGAKLWYMEQVIDQYYLFDEDVEREDPVELMYAAYVLSLKDPYSSYYTVEDYNSLMESTEGEYCGVGVMVSQNVYTGIVTVIKVFKDAPADVAGMLPGDIITAVGDMSISGMDLSLVVSDYIKGEEGTDVTLTVYRESVDEYIDLTMKRAMVQNPTVEYEMLESNIGYIALSAFEEVSTEQFIKAVEDLESQGMESLIVDLRNNGGGVVTAAEGISDYLIEDGKTIVSFKGKGVEDSTYVAKDGHAIDVPLVVLVNEQSASASEVLTGALKDNDTATVVGTKTFGKGIAQGIFPIPDGSALKLTTAYYYVPSGECIHEVGIEPDVEVELKEELKSMVEVPKEDDNQLQAAIDVLLEGEEVVKERLEEEAKLAEALLEAEPVTEAESDSESETEADNAE